MREIKFRFWSRVLGNFVIPDDSILAGAFKDEKMVVMQFTGLYDKNGKEIYEGDIVKVDWKDHEFMIKVFTVTWNLNGWYCFYNNEKDGKAGYRVFPYNGAYDGRKLIEIIGNIYQNPELIK